MTSDQWQQQTIGSAEAAQILSVSPEYIPQLCVSGQLTAKRIGRDWAIHRPSVEARAASDVRPGRPPKEKTPAGA
ncbi:MAG: helix-turn-helix domain-containing protein [Planctomycetota bacterium]